MKKCTSESLKKKKRPSNSDRMGEEGGVCAREWAMEEDEEKDGRDGRRELIGGTEGRKRDSERQQESTYIWV